jgi:hypothetical protein
MKKQLLFLMLSAIFFSCKKNTNDIAPKPAHITPQNKVMYAGDGQWDLLGYAYNITGDYASSYSATFPAIDVQKLRITNPSMLQPSGSETTTTTFQVGENATDFLSKYSGATNIKGGDGLLFKGTVDLNFSNTDKWSSKYIYGVYNQKVIKRGVYVMKDLAILKANLDAKFASDINTLSSADLVNRYGTHVLTDIRLGGKMEIIYRAETTNSNRITAASAGVETSFVKIFGIKTTGTYDENLLRTNFNQSITARTVGGASEKFLSGITIGADLRPSATIDVAGWSSGVTDANSELIDIIDAIPIYDLITDQTKKAAVQSYINTYLADHKISLTPEDVHQYMSDTYADHYYTIQNEGTTTGGGKWKYEKVPFKAFTSNVPGTIPVYQYMSDTYSDHYYTTTNEGPTAGGGAWKYEKIAFYAFAKQEPGTVPVYVYFSQMYTDHYYTKTYEGTTTGSGNWKYEKVAFYTYP